MYTLTYPLTYKLFFWFFLGPPPKKKKKFQEKGRRPRININFRMIIPNKRETEGGQKTYYKYMRYGDDSVPPSWTYRQLLRKSNSLLSMLSSSSSSSSSKSSSSKSSTSSSTPSAASDAPLPDRKEATTSGSSSSSSSSSDENVEEWQCTACTLLNAKRYNCCQVCGQRNTNKRSSSTTGAAALSSSCGLKAKRPKIKNTITRMFQRHVTSTSTPSEK